MEFQSTFHDARFWSNHHWQRRLSGSLALGFPQQGQDNQPGSRDHLSSKKLASDLFGGTGGAEFWDDVEGVLGIFENHSPFRCLDRCHTDRLPHPRRHTPRGPSRRDRGRQASRPSAWGRYHIDRWRNRWRYRETDDLPSEPEAGGRCHGRIHLVGWPTRPTLDDASRIIGKHGKDRCGAGRNHLG